MSGPKGAVAPVVLYAAEIWGQNAKSSKFKKTLRAIQRPFLLAITGAYRTPNDLLEVVAGTPPLHLEAITRYRLGELVGDKVARKAEKRLGRGRRDEEWQAEWDR